MTSTIYTKYTKDDQKNTQYKTESVCFYFESKAMDCGVILRKKGDRQSKQKIPFIPSERVGLCYKKILPLSNPYEYEYQFYEEDQMVPDPYAKALSGRVVYGNSPKAEDIWASFLEDDFDWEKDQCPRIFSQNSIWYQLHVRGFTRSKSSGVSHPGTYEGVIQKLPYLQSLGITTIEMLPTYEFLEKEKEQLNYWGFKPGFYYIPKRGYAIMDSVREFKEMVKQIHKMGLEIILQFYFEPCFNQSRIADILSYWKQTYHIDGFHLLGVNLPVDYLSNHLLLAECKLIFDSLPHATDTAIFRPINIEGARSQESILKGNSIVIEKDQAYNPFISSKDRIGLYRDEFLYAGRRFLRGDEDCLSAVLRQLRLGNSDHFELHFLSNYWGFTLMDMVSYDRKHNEQNGEDNRDGSDYNCSWNCGEEGKSRKQKVKALRSKQIKNALSLLFLNASIPLIYMGDEMGNTQNGNNNPYCIDSKVTWLDWSDSDKNRDIVEYFKELIRLREQFSVISRNCTLMDDINCGYPDLSYHGNSAWRGDFHAYAHQIGLLFCEKYHNPELEIHDSLLYVALNLNWSVQKFALPKVAKGYSWYSILSSDQSVTFDLKKDELTVNIPPRTVVYFGCRQISQEEKGSIDT